MIYPKSLNVTRIYRSTFERSLTFSRIYKSNEEAAFNEIISVSTDESRVADILKESYELIGQTIMKEVHEFQNTMNTTVMQQLQKSDIDLSNKVACSSALFEASLTNTLNISNKQACAQFSKPSKL